MTNAIESQTADNRKTLTGTRLGVVVGDKRDALTRVAHKMSYHCRFVERRRV